MGRNKRPIYRFATACKCHLPEKHSCGDLGLRVNNLIASFARNETKCIEKIFFETMPADKVKIVEKLGLHILFLQANLSNQVV